jgi:AbrB family looped-hinge helix DNA binding protein
MLSLRFTHKHPGFAVHAIFDCHLVWNNGIYTGMNLHVQMDPAGRVVLPKKVRDRFRLQGGDTLALEIKGDTIQLRPQPTKARLERVNGVLVLVSETPLPEGRDLVAEAREERIDQIARRPNEPE